MHIHNTYYIYIIHIYIYNKLTDQNSKIHFEVPKRDIHSFKKIEF